jgi:Leucine Rich repeat
MVLIAAIALVLGLFLGPIRDQRLAVAWAARHDGYVEYFGPKAPAWAVNLLGGEPFQRVVLIEFHFLTAPQPGARRVDDGGLAYLRRLYNLEHLNLSSTRVTDRGLEIVAGLRRLQWLNLAFTSVTNAGLARLGNLSELQCLDLHAARQVSDDGLVQLRRLGKLAELELYDNPRITDAGLDHLRGMTSLRVLDLRATAVTDQGVDRLQRSLPNLQIRR